ncbi:MAG: ankyrin repeat domain-containing protein, partial [Cyanobacteria bacterium]|nr:ankyrin repeat domain-containing protein [Cyanobacteriota bacterium]
RCPNERYPFAKNSPLSSIIKTLDRSWVALLLKHGASLHLPDSETKRSPLEEAIFSHKPEMIAYLIAQGADVNCDSHNSFHFNYHQRSTTPLHATVINNDVETAKRLLQVGADPNRTTASFGPALQLIFWREKYSNSPGQNYDAERDNNKEMLQLLLDAGTDLNPKDPQQSPFKGVLECWDQDPRRMELVKLILDYGAKIPEGDLNRLYNTIGYPKFRLSMDHFLKDEKTAKAQRLSQLGAATIRGNLSRIQNLQKNGFSLNEPPSSQENESFYHLAVESGNLEIVDYLLTQKLEPSPLFVQNLITTNNLAVIKKLAPFPQYLDRPDSLGRSPLHMAAKSGQLEMVKFLMQIGADVNRGDVMGKTPVMLAKQFGHQSVETLLQGASYFS